MINSNPIVSRSALVSIAPFVLFVVVLGTGIWMANLYEAHWHEERRARVRDVASAQAFEIERRLNASLSATHILASVVRQNRGDFPSFEQYAGDIIASLGGITNLQLAPQGVIAKIHPLAGHERALGHDVLRDDSRRSEAWLAVKSHKLTLAGPFELIQGGIAVIGRNPVFVEDEQGVDRFWGFTSMLLYLDELLAATDVPELAQRGYLYQLSRQHPDTGKLHLFAGVTDHALGNSEAAKIVVPNGLWTLRIAPIDPLSHAPGYPWQLATALVVAALAGYLLLTLLRRPAELERRVEEKTIELEALAFHDPLTGLENRQLFQERLPKAVRAAQRTGRSMALLYVDLDDFKRINDTLGHDRGDMLLTKIGERLRDAVREEDFVARVGGDEFTVLLPRVESSEVVVTVARKLLSVLQHPIAIDSHEVTISCSIGITLGPDDGQDGTILMKNADLAMYRAKEQGRNRYQFFTSRMNVEAENRLEVEMALRRALERDEFVLHFQPQVALGSGRIVGMEALLRWASRERGTVMPADFLPVAEDTGLIIPIGKWVLREACAAARTVQSTARHPVRVAVNLSHRQFHDPALEHLIEDALCDSGLPPDLLEIEITENVLIADVGQAVERLAGIKRLGATVSIDDFGTGYSSLGQLKGLPVDRIKIDRMFIKDIPEDQRDMDIAAAVIAMSHKLKLEVVAEGVEREEQLRFLERSGCDVVQGQLLSTEAARIARWLGRATTAEVIPMPDRRDRSK